MRPVVQNVPNAQMPEGLFGDELLEGDFLSDLDKAFETLQMTPKKATKVAKAKAKKARVRDYEQMHKTFLEVVQVHLCPTLRYLKAIQHGVASRDLCEIVHYVIAPIIGKTRKVGLTEHTKALINFQRNLKNVLKTRSHRMTSEQRVALSQSFGPVQKVFKLDFRGHSTAVVNLLGFYKTLKRDEDLAEDDLKKLFSVGIPSLTMLRTSAVEELVSLSGIAPTKISTLRLRARKFSILSMF